MALSPDLGFMYLAEKVSPEDNIVKNIEVYDKHGIFYVEFDSILQTFLEMNRNSRQYLSENLKECIFNDSKI